MHHTCWTRRSIGWLRDCTLLLPRLPLPPQMLAPVMVLRSFHELIRPASRHHIVSRDHIVSHRHIVNRHRFVDSGCDSRLLPHRQQMAARGHSPSSCDKDFRWSPLRSVTHRLGRHILAAAGLVCGACTSAPRPLPLLRRPQPRVGERVCCFRGIAACLDSAVPLLLRVTSTDCFDSGSKLPARHRSRNGRILHFHHFLKLHSLAVLNQLPSPWGVLLPTLAEQPDARTQLLPQFAQYLSPFQM